MNPNIFRQYDVRGVVDEDLTPEVVRALGRGFASEVLEQGGRVLAVGRDGRLTGPQLRDDFVEGALAAGVNVLDVGMVPTPVLYFAAHHLQPDGAVQITGSHNPPEFNGFKMMLGRKSFFGEQIQQLYRRIVDGRFSEGSGETSTVDVIPDYINHLQNNIKLRRPVRVAIDSGNGAAGAVAPDIFRAIGCEPVELFSEVDGTFPNHHPDPTLPESLVDLRRVVDEQSLECGIGYDGDGDRIGVIDNEGSILWGDRLLALFARYVLKEHPGGTIIGEVKCSKALYEDIEKHGGNGIMWRTGHSFLKQKLREEDAVLAGEMSGHMFFNDRYFGFDDAIYASARLAEILSLEERPLSELLGDLPVYPSTPEIRVDCPDEIKFEVVEKVAEHFKGNYDVVDIDGVRVNFEHGWGLLRASNTQPVLVMRFEADEQEQVEQYRREIERLVDEVRESL